MNIESGKSWSIAIFKSLKKKLIDSESIEQLGILHNQINQWDLLRHVDYAKTFKY